MSVDAQLAHACPHLLVEERASLAADRQELVLRAPAVNTSMVRVSANDLLIPASGLASQAQLFGVLAGPFRIDPCDTEFVLTTSVAQETFTLRPGRLSTTVLAQQLMARIPTLVVEVIDGRLVLTDLGSVGPTSRIQVGGSAAASLGFPVQTGARGAQVYPGWQVVGQSPRFNAPLRGNPFVKVTYVTQPPLCPRCQGTYVENDARFSLGGEVLLVANEDLLYQAALKIILTRIRSNPFAPFYGSALTSRVGVKAIGATASLLREDVVTALATMQRLQREQAQFQVVTPQERLMAILAVDVQPFPQDPTAFHIEVTVQNAAQQPITLSVVFTVPGVIALQGSNGKSLGL